jgi:hypothetical protein
VERTDQGADGPAGISDSFVGQAPVAATLPGEYPISETTGNEAPLSLDGGLLEPLLTREISEHMRTRWNEIQRMFVDDPRSAVQQADALVSIVVAQITQMFATEQSLLEGQWKRGNDISTEDLRRALQRYRSFFNRLVI